MSSNTFVDIVNYIQLTSTILVVSILALTSFLIYKWSNNDLFNYDKKANPLPITLVLPTWNENILIKSKLKNVMNQNFPSHLLEIIIIDAGSEDGTLDIIESWQKSLNNENGPFIKIIKENKRLGKSVSINRAFSEARSESKILMMSDIDCRLNQNTLLNIGKIFQDESIGAVTARQILINSETPSSQNEANYRDFYSKIRVAESSLDSTPIFHGECSAYRREAIKNHRLIENANADDSQMAVAARISGYRAIYDPNLTFFEAAPPDNKSTNIQKVRRAQGLSRHFWRNKRHIFNPQMGNFRKILALEFSLHIILPWVVFFGFIFGFIHIGFILNNQGLDLTLISELTYLERLLLSLDSIVIILLLLGHLKIRFPLAKTSSTFFQYMIILLISHFHMMRGNSLHLWKQVPLVRESLSEFDREKN